MIDETEQGEVDTGEMSKDASPWLDLISEAEKKFRLYQDKMDNIDKVYANLKELAEGAGDREFQIFWANLEVLKPAIYSRPPVPAVTPRFKDRKDLPNKASELLERVLSSSFEEEDIHEPLKMVRDDLAIGGRGVAWLRFDDADGESVKFEHIDRKDFLHGTARKWAEVGWVARRVWLTRKKGLKRFGDKFLLASFERRDDEEEGKVAKEAPVWEIWSKDERKVVWVSPGMEEVLDIQEPFLDLRGFFPCPKPAYGTVERGSLLPMPDYVYYRDQADEINEMTARISALAESLRMKGFYASGAEDVAEAVEAALKTNDQNAVMVPVSNNAAFGNGALKDAVVWLPVNEIAQTIVSLVELRRQFIEDVYQITGLSDIMRGATNPNETLGAQELKSQYGSIRVRERQEAMVTIARDMTRMAAEIIAENFSPETLVRMSQSDLPSQAVLDQEIADMNAKIQQAQTDPQVQQMAQANPEKAQEILQQVAARKQEIAETITIEKVVELLRSDRTRPFILDIETDSTIQPDENAEKARRTEFLTAIGGFISQAFPIVQQAPQTGEFVAEALRFAASGFRAGRQLDGVIDDLAEKIKEAPAQSNQPDPAQQLELQKAQLDMQAMQLDMQKVAAETKKTNAETEKTLAEIKKILAEATQSNVQSVDFLGSI